MKALLCTSPGPAETLVFDDVGCPEPGPGEVQISVGAVALNFLDTLIIEGRYQVRPDFPFSPGAELCGRIIATGAGVEGMDVGVRVVAFPGTGALAQTAIARADQVLAIPETLEEAVAAGLPIAFGTAIHALKDRAGLKAGETVLVLGAAGGAGLAAVGCARAMGARVIAAASNEQKLDLARAHGAEITINTSRDDLRDRLRETTANGSVDVVFDPVGGALSEPAFRATAWGGRFLVVGFASGDIPQLPLNLPLVKGSAIVGVYWGGFAARDPAANRANFSQVLRWIGEGSLTPHVGAIYGFSEAKKAIADLAGRKAMGKIVVRI